MFCWGFLVCFFWFSLFLEWNSFILKMLRPFRAVLSQWSLFTTQLGWYFKIWIFFHICLWFFGSCVMGHLQISHGLPYVSAHSNVVASLSTWGGRQNMAVFPPLRCFASLELCFYDGKTFHWVISSREMLTVLPACHFIYHRLHFSSRSLHRQNANALSGSGV